MYICVCVCVCIHTLLKKNCIKSCKIKINIHMCTIKQSKKKSKIQLKKYRTNND